MASTHRRPGATLLELLVVIAIIAVLAGLTLPAVMRVRDVSARVQCANNLRQLGLAAHAYHDASGTLPPGVRRSPDPYPFLGWGARLLPYLEQAALWEQTQNDYRRERLFVTPSPAYTPHPGLLTPLSVFVCPADGRASGHLAPENFHVALTHYLGVSGLTSNHHDGVLYLDSRIAFRDVTDGTSTTLLIGERPPSLDHRFGWWYAGVGQQFNGSADMVLGVQEPRTTFRTPTCPQGPYEYGPGSLSNPCDIFHFWSRHIGGAHFVFVDGSVRFVGYSSRSLLPALATRSGQEAAAIP